jgi:glutamate racemase
MSDPRPLGVFDSGIGGLTVLRALKQRLPAEPLLYLGDTARVPYGTRSDETVLRYAREAMAFFLGKGVKAVVVACNTVSAVALDALAAEAKVPIVGVLEPGAAEAVRRTRSGRVGVIGTQATIRSGAYARRIEALHPGAVVMQRACPLFVPLAEEGWTENEVARSAAARYLAGVSRTGARVVVLGCTHYPLLAQTIALALPRGTILVNSAETTARAVEAALRPGSRRGETSPGTTRLLVTDASERLRRVAGRFLGRPAADLTLVDLP